jgi:membrane protease YdiL (CAAX protease family)
VTGSAYGMMFSPGGTLDALEAARPVLIFGYVGLISSALLVALPLSWRAGARHIWAIGAVAAAAPAVVYLARLPDRWQYMVARPSVDGVVGALAWSLVPIVGAMVVVGLGYARPDPGGEPDLERPAHD